MEGLREDDPYDLDRFVRAQEGDFERALAELRGGRKRSHWMWYIFPQAAGLGSSPTSVRYAIRSLAEARAYLGHPVLGPRLEACARALLALEGTSAAEILGTPDDLKLRSCATLFACVSPPGSVFEALLDKYSAGVGDPETLRLVGGEVAPPVVSREDPPLGPERRKAPSENEQLKLLLEAVVETADVWINTLDSEGRVVLWNGAAERISGYTKAEARGNPAIWEWLYPDPAYRAEIVRKVGEILAQEASVTDFITRLRDKAGSEHLVSWDSRALLAPDGTPAGSLAIGRDVTASRRAEEALLESERRLTKLIANLPGFVYQTVNEPGWPMRYISEGCRPITGYGPEAFLGERGLRFTSLIRPEFQAPLFSKWMKLLKEGGVFEDEYPIRTASGEERWLWERGSGFHDERGRLLGVEGFITDITQRKRAEESLRKASVALEQSPVIILITDRAGNIEYVNTAFTRNTGYTLEEARGQNPRLLKSGDHSREFYRELWNTLLAGRTWQGRFHNRRKDETLYWESATISPLRDKEGTITHFVAAKENITEAIRSEEERRNLERQLAQAQKLESLGSLAGGVAHDMNNVLAAILSLATIEGESAPPDSTLRGSMDTIAKACLRGGSLVKGLLGFARESLAEERLLDLNALVREEVAILERTTLQKVRLAMDLAEDLRVVKGDPAALSHALMNLCVNAVDAMPEGGDLTLRTRNDGDASVLLEVADTGYGMPAEVQEKALDPFFTTKPQGKGTGLGLSIVYGAVKAHHGDLRIQSAPGQGTTVRLRLPACEQAREAPRSEMRLPVAARPLRVLVVDDDELVQDSTRQILKVLGHTPTIAGGGEEALGKFEAGLEVDLVLLDLNMPGMDGAETLDRIRALHPELPVLLATGRADQQALDLVHRVPRVTLLPKPYSMKDLRALLASESL